MADATSGGTNATGLPKGLGIDKTNGNITITPSIVPGTYTVTITATAPSYTSSATTLTSTSVSATYTFLVTSTAPSLSGTTITIYTTTPVSLSVTGFITSYTISPTTLTTDSNTVTINIDTSNP
ncbi:putative Ig domain-containing protein [Tropheryma whipplei]|uniref:putative Ig domain-containing protein n=1 Tax=Tropheryma whipplei TaxID=2039 RepID=UPI00031D312D|nr:putative Ig domain-containing protein [Tropheryma whipplei]